MQKPSKIKYIFYKTNSANHWQFFKTRFQDEKCEKFCKERGFKDYKILNLNTTSAFDLHLVTDIIYLDEKYYFPEDIIPYPKTKPKGIEYFKGYFIWEKEFANDEEDYDEVYNKPGFDRGFGYLWTDITSKFILPDKTIELHIVAQGILKYLLEFIEKLEKDNFTVYINDEYSFFKWLAWVKDDKIRLIHQDYNDKEVKTEFDILLDKDWFIHFCYSMLKTMKNHTGADEKLYKKFVKDKYDKGL